MLSLVENKTRHNKMVVFGIIQYKYGKQVVNKISEIHSMTNDWFVNNNPFLKVKPTI